MKELLKLFLLSFLLFFLYNFQLSYAYGETFSITSNNSWNTYSHYFNQIETESFLGKAEEVNFPGSSSFNNISSDAKWIWAPNISNSSSVADLTSFYFYREFSIPINSSNYNGEINIVVDDLAEIFINGNSVDTHGSIEDVSLSGNYVKLINFSHYLHPGKNYIMIRAQNGPSSFSGANCTNCTWQENPAGVLFEVKINYDNTLLPVPTFYQTSNYWGQQLYDNANMWSSSSPYIKDWGCALTAYAMILKYFGYNKLPNGDDLNPGTLNIWLKNNSGFIDGKKTGYVNPLAISSLSKQAKSINKINSHDALEYSRINTSNPQILKTIINKKIPAILDVGGHFVVAKGIENNTFNISDPYYENRTLLNSYPNGFNYIGIFTPSSTDLSYMLIVGSKNLSIELRNKNATIPVDGFIESPLINDNTNEQLNSSLKYFFVVKPNTDNYQLILSGHKNKENLQVYLYDKNGKYKIFKETVSLANKSSRKINIFFDHNDVKKSKINHGNNYY